jgi:hypothetical protein
VEHTLKESPLTVVVYEGQPDRAAKLQAAVADADIEVFARPARDLWTHPGLDAISVSIPMAEKWGARPTLYEAQVLPTSDDDRAHGLPPYVIAGIATDPDDQRRPEALLSLALNITFHAVDRFNTTHPTPLRTIGFMSQHLLGGQLDPQVIGRCLTRALLHNDDEA